MTLIAKPDMEFIWASGGAIVQPPGVKVQTGWTPEVPPHQWENWVQNRQDQYIAHVNQRGIPTWDGNTEYEASGLSYVQGSNGTLYKSVAASGPTTTVQDPTTDVTTTYWNVAFPEYPIPMNSIRVSTAKSNLAALTTSVDIGGVSVRDSTDTFNLKLSGTLTGILQTSGSWAAGNNQNKLLSGARVANTTYHGFVIRKTSDGSTDIGFHTGLDPSAVMPVGFAGFRRVCSLITLPDGTIKRFEYKGSQCLFNNPLRDINVTGAGATTALYTVGVPAGIQVQAIMQMFARSTVGSAAYNINEPGNDDIILYNGPTIVSPAANQTVGFGRVYVFTNTSSQIQIAASVGGNTYSGGAYGFVDTREV